MYLWDVATATRLTEAGPPTDMRDNAGGTLLPPNPTFSSTIRDIIMMIYFKSSLHQHCQRTVRFEVWKAQGYPMASTRRCLLARTRPHHLPKNTPFKHLETPDILSTSITTKCLEAALLIPACKHRPTCTEFHCAGSIPERWQPGYVFSLGAQPDDGRLLAACCSDGSVRAWAREGGGLTPLTGLRLHNAMGSAAAWHADGCRIAATFIDGSISVLVSAASLNYLSQMNPDAAVSRCCGDCAIF